MWWTGSIASIPPTYRLCDGSRLTPDLRDKFIVGAGSTYAVDETGGQLLHAHNFDTAIHLHDLDGGAGVDLGSDFNLTLSTNKLVGTTDNGSSLPRFHSLVLVMYDGRLL